MFNMLTVSVYLTVVPVSLEIPKFPVKELNERTITHKKLSKAQNL